MNLRKITLTVLMLIAGNTFAQSISSNLVRSQSNLAFLDSIKRTFVNDNLASRVDSLWFRHLQ